MHNEGNCKQDENIAFRVGESNSKESNWQGINMPNLEAAHTTQHQKANKQKNQKTNNPIKK